MLNMREQRTVTPDRKQRIDTYLERISRPWYWKGNPGKTWQPCWVEERKLGFWRRTRQLMFLGQALRKRELHTERPGTCRRFSSRIWQATDQWMYVRKQSEVWVKAAKRMRGNNAQCSHRAGNSACSHQPDWETTIHRALGRVYRRILSQSWDIISPKMSIVEVPPNKS